MASRTAVVVSGALYAAASMFSYPLIGWKLDGWALLLVGMLHLVIVLRCHPRLDGFVVGLHYLVALVGLAGAVGVILDVSGWSSGVGGVLWNLLRDRWGDPVSYALAGIYVLLVTAFLLLAVVTISWLIRRRSPTREELLAGLFVASLLNIPCDFAFRDALAQVAVLDPVQAQAFVIAIGVDSLQLPLLLHALVVAAVLGTRHSGGS